MMIGQVRTKAMHVMLGGPLLPNDNQHLIILFFYFYSPASEQAVVSGLLPSPRYVPSVFIAHRVQHSHCSSTFIDCC